MRKTVLFVSLIILDLVTWVGLLLFMNSRPPDSTNQLLFLIILALAMGLGTMAISLGVSRRRPPVRGARTAVPRAARQGVLVGVLAAVLMALRFMRSLNLITAIVLTFIMVLVELLFYLRSR